LKGSHNFSSFVIVVGVVGTYLNLKDSHNLGLRRKPSRLIWMSLNLKDIDRTI